MCQKHRNLFQYHVEYIQDDIIKNFKVRIIHYAKRVGELHDPARYLHPTSKKGDMFDRADWTVRNHEFMEDDIHITTKAGLHPTM